MLDRSFNAAIANGTGGLTPTSIAIAFADWSMHLALSPGKQMQLAVKLARKAVRLGDHLVRAALDPAVPPCIVPLPQDHRFNSPEWNTPPFNLLRDTFLLGQQWWDAATTGVAGVSGRHEALVRFFVRQLLDSAAPTNFIATNPVVQKRIWDTGGQCLATGVGHMLDDWRRCLSRERPAGADAFRVGEELACTPGKIVFRNRLIELIQYEPATALVHREPILIVPAWIMKYYILDLSPENSLVRWLVSKGFTVFMISWKNPDASDSDLGLDDYRELGIMAALGAVEAIAGAVPVHGVGYCLGGTLLAIAAAALARDGSNKLATLTLLAAQTDFSDPGELGLFIDDSQIAFLEDMMWAHGYLDSRQMSGAFQLLRSNDLIWSRAVQHYLMGDREPMSDLMAWNSDGTRLPFAMHVEYLRSLFLRNDLAEGRLKAGGKPVSLEDITCDIFVVATEWDHVAPWRSVYKIHQLAQAPVTFLLTSGGHNAGIVSPPDRKGRSYRIACQDPRDINPDPESWYAAAEDREGSWWLAWLDWIASRSGPLSAPPLVGNPTDGFPALGSAPGTYVRQA